MMLLKRVDIMKKKKLKKKSLKKVNGIQTTDTSNSVKKN